MKLGKAFSDSVVVEKKRVMRLVNDNTRSWWLGVGRALVFTVLFFALMFVLVWRLFDLTLVQGHRMRSLADGNRTRELIRHAPRGILYDRTGVPLVRNVPEYRLLMPCERQGSPCQRRLTKEEGEKAVSDGLADGTFLEVDYQREYLYPESLFHLAGFTGEITERELADEYYALRNYRPGDRLGRTGAEAVFESKLRGRDGKELVEIDATGKILRVIGQDTELPGEPITLAVDSKLSEVVRTSFPVGKRGAVVVSKPKTGEILALFSSPTFPANKFSLGMGEDEYEALLEDPERPMFNRAIGGVYPPGSTFKLVTALAALEEGAVNAATTVEDIGVITIGPFRFPNWFFQQYGKTDGVVDIKKAIQRSNDIFFYRTGEWLGITKLVDWAHRLGLGRPLGIELSGEASGLMPDPEWKKQRFDTLADREARNDQWYLGDTYHVSIGQGYLLVTPLQVNAWTNVIASGGSLCRPTILKSKHGLRCKDLDVKKDTVSMITEGMIRACEPGGTGWPLFDFGIKRDSNDANASPSARLVRVPVACKTGTAEFGDPKNRTHAWFTAFAPAPESFTHGAGQASQSETNVFAGEPEISVTVLVEGAGEGSNVAAPIAKKILEEWFSR